MSDPPSMQLREVWGAAPRRNSPRRRAEPVALVLHHTAGNRPADNAAAFETIRATQRHHQDGNGWTDIAYNLVVTPDGGLFEGRGTDFQNGANTPRNRNTLSICLLGDFRRDTMTAAEKTTVARVARHYGLPTIPHSAVSSTECPGDRVRAWLDAGMPTGPDTDRADRIRAAFAALRAAVDEAEAATVE